MNTEIVLVWNPPDGSASINSHLGSDVPFLNNLPAKSLRVESSKLICKHFKGEL